MPRNKLIVRYAKEIGIDENVVNEAIVSFFTYFKSCIKMKSLPDIRLKGFGVYKPALSRLKQYLNGIEKKHNNSLIEKEEYEYKKEMITKYLQENDYEKSHN